MEKSIYRTMDVNFNRSREGLRVCEEVARFILNDKRLFNRLKKLRHDIELGLDERADLKKELLQARDTAGDVGKKNSPLEFKRKDAKDIFEANIERSKEAVRALEEFGKLFNKNWAVNFKRIRFQLYELEKQTYKKLEALRNIK